ncbi:MAG: helix-turn-helix domain-containing protein [Clostridia bacterium]
MEQKEIIYTKKDVIEKYKPMFTEWSLSKLIRERKIKYIKIGRKIFITKQAVDEFIKKQEETNIILGERRLQIV